MRRKCGGLEVSIAFHEVEGRGGVSAGSSCDEVAGICTTDFVIFLEPRSCWWWAYAHDNLVPLASTVTSFCLPFVICKEANPKVPPWCLVAWASSENGVQCVCGE